MKDVKIWSTGVDANGTQFSKEAIELALQRLKASNGEAVPISLQYQRSNPVGVARDLKLTGEGYLVADVDTPFPHIKLLIDKGLLTSENIVIRPMFSIVDSHTIEDISVVTDFYFIGLTLLPPEKGLPIPTPLP